MFSQGLGVVKDHQQKKVVGKRMFEWEMFPKQIRFHAPTFSKVMPGAESLQEDGVGGDTACQHQGATQLLCNLLFAQQEECLAGKQWQDELSRWATSTYSLQIERW